MHLLEQIQNLYGGHLHNTAKRCCPDWMDLEDAKSDLLLATHEWITSRSLLATDASKVITIIKCRGLDLQRKWLRYGSRNHFSGIIPETLSDTVGNTGVDISRHSREAELRTLLWRKIGGLDSIIIILLVFPPAHIQEYARKHPVRGCRAKRKVNSSKPAVVKKWHVASVLGISRTRVSTAMARLRHVLRSQTYNWVGELNGVFESKEEEKPA